MDTDYQSTAAVSPGGSSRHTTTTTQVAAITTNAATTADIDCPGPIGSVRQYGGDKYLAELQLSAPSATGGAAGGNSATAPVVTSQGAGSGSSPAAMVIHDRFGPLSRSRRGAGAAHGELSRSRSLHTWGIVSQPIYQPAACNRIVIPRLSPFH